MKITKSAKILLFSSLFILAGFSFSQAAEEDYELTTPVLMEDSILSRSQISYKALDRRKGLHTYSVVISCVEGKISFIKTLFLTGEGSESEPIRQLGIMNKSDYLALWETLKENHLLGNEVSIEVPNPSPTSASIHLMAKVGETQFKSFSEDLTSPASKPLKNVKTQIDAKALMSSLWDKTSFTAKK